METKNWKTTRDFLTHAPPPTLTLFPKALIGSNPERMTDGYIPDKSPTISTIRAKINIPSNEKSKLKSKGTPPNLTNCGAIK